jgi:BTB/POZ domain-containing protein KCTD9
MNSPLIGLKRYFKHVIGKIEELAADRPVMLAFIVFILIALIVIPLSIPYYIADPQGMIMEILAEAHGTLFDLLIIGWLLMWFSRIADRRRRLNRYQEEIEDFVGWRSPEATHRLVGNIRRLNRLGITEKVRLIEAHLRGARLGGVKMCKSDLWGADLQGAVLRESDLRDTNFAGADLAGVDLERSDVSGADLRGASLKEADLERATMRGTDLRGANLTGADLQYAVLVNADLERATLTGANLHNANLEGADLRNAMLDSANLRGARLDGADLRFARLDQADLTRASLLGARLPEGALLTEMFKKARCLDGIQVDPMVRSRLDEAGAAVEACSIDELERRDAIEKAHQKAAPLEEDSVT